MKRPSFAFSSRTVPAFLLVITLIAFAPLLPKLGLYWDDWAKILVARLWGLKEYFSYYAEDRPLSALTHIVFTPLLGTSPLPWHIFTLILRWLSAWGLWWALDGLWPRARVMTVSAAALFIICPVFISEPAAVTFHQQWLQYALFFVSLGAMIYAVRARQAGGPGANRRFWALTGLALAATLAQFTVTEYFVPLELTRPLILWFLVSNAACEQAAAGGPRPTGLWGRVRAVGLAWLPYLTVAGVYSVYRLFFMRLPGADPYRAEMLYALLGNPAAALRQLGLNILEDESYILVSAWADMLKVSFTNNPPFTLLSYALGAVASGLAVVYLVALREANGAGADDRPNDSPGRWVGQAVLLGTLAVLLGPVPAWITGRQVVFDFHSDRYAMPAMFGAALLQAGLIAWLAQRRLQRVVMAAVLVGLAVGLHLRVANDYRWLWTSEQRFFWQLAWRAPGLKAPTALFMLDEPFANQGLFSTSAALNLLYPQPEGWGAPLRPGQPEGTRNLAYWIYTIRPRYNHAPDSNVIDLSSQFRTLKFQGKTPENSLLVFQNLAQGNCLWVLSARDVDHPYVPDLVKVFIPISNLGQIEPQPLKPGYPPVDLIGPEPARTWCYYFEKADLARQTADWRAVTRLYDDATAAGYSLHKTGSESPYEWLPFLEGLGQTGRWAETAQLAGDIYTKDPKYQPMVCAVLDQLPAAQGPADPAFTAARANLGCGRP